MISASKSSLSGLVNSLISPSMPCSLSLTRIAAMFGSMATMVCSVSYSTLSASTSLVTVLIPESFVVSVKSVVSSLDAAFCPSTRLRILKIVPSGIPRKFTCSPWTSKLVTLPFFKNSNAIFVSFVVGTYMKKASIPLQ